MYIINWLRLKLRTESYRERVIKRAERIYRLEPNPIIRKQKLVPYIQIFEDWKNHGAYYTNG